MEDMEDYTGNNAPLRQIDPKLVVNNLMEIYMGMELDPWMEEAIKDACILIQMRY